MYVLCIFLAAFIWGVCLVGQSAGMEVMGPFSFSAVRLTLGGVSMIPLAIILDIRKSKERKKGDLLLEYKNALKHAAIAGPIILTCILFQQYALIYTSVGKCAFITAFYLFIVPGLEMLLGRKNNAGTWKAVVLAIIGIYILTMSGGVEKVNIGDILSLGVAATYSVYMLVVEKHAYRVDVIKFAMLQFLICGLISFIFAVFLEPGQITLENCIHSIVPILITGILSCAVGYTLQIIGQSGVSASTCTIILSSETIFSLLAGMIILNERMYLREYIGCGVMIIAIIVSLRGEFKAAKDKPAKA